MLKNSFTEQFTLSNTVVNITNEPRIIANECKPITSYSWESSKCIHAYRQPGCTTATGNNDFYQTHFSSYKKGIFINILNFDNLQQQYSTTPSPISYSLNSSQVIRPESLRPQIVTQSHHTQYQVKN